MMFKILGLLFFSAASSAGLSGSFSHLYNALDDLLIEEAKNVYEIRLDYESIKFNEFPNEFKFRLDEKDIQIDFIKLNKTEHHPIASSDIYVIDQKTKQPILYDGIDYSDDDYIEHEFYVQKVSDYKKFGHATLFKSKNHANHFKILANIVDDNYNLLEVKPANQNNKYSIKKILNNRRKRDAFNYDDIKDYIDKMKKKASKNLHRQSFSKNELTVELLVVVDTTVYNDHIRYSNTTNQNLVYQHMKIYFSHVIYGANQRFANSLSNDPDLMISLKLTNFLFLNNPSDLFWLDSSTDSNIKIYNQRQVVLGSRVTNAFASFMNSKTFTFQYDHAVAYFDRDIWSDDTSLDAASRATVRGYSFIGQICDSNRYSVVEETGGFFSVLTTAHEIGHNLGALHDDGSNCPFTSNFIMVLSPLYNYNPLNLLRFSQCSIERFKFNLLTSNGDVSDQAQCLKNVPSSLASEFTNVADQPFTGLIWNADDQCKMMFGERSEFCRSMSSSICTALFCKISTNLTCQAYPGGAAEGTVCASGKICIKGVCSQDPRAPQGQCVLGENTITQDVVGIRLPNQNGMTCQDVLDYAFNDLNQSPNVYCQDERFSKLCCNTCLKYNKMTCTDDFIDCQKMKPFCQSAGIGNTPLYAVCKRTCSFNCQPQPLNCADSRNLCQNGATCLNTFPSDSNALFGFRCLCSVGFYGEYCEKKNPCLPNPCMNGATCQNIGSQGYYCNCKNNCRGINCQQCDSFFIPTQFLFQTTTTTTSTTRSSTTIYQTIQLDNNIPTSNCRNVNDFACNYFIRQLGFECKPTAFIGTIQITQYCQSTCNLCRSPILPTTTVVANLINTQTCLDSSTSCEFWRNHCYLIRNINPHPCRKTCQLC